VKAWLQLIRWPNLLMVTLAQVLFKYSFLPSFNIPPALSDLDFLLLCISIIFVTAAGNIINDICDIRTDFINQRFRPLAQQKISISKAFGFYVALNILALIVAAHLGLKYQLPEFIGVVFAVISVLYLYSKFLKGIPLLGNIIVSLLVSLSFLLVVYIELFSIPHKQISIELIFWIIGYGIFAFWANLNREMVKDVQDIKGDYAKNISTLPILLGRSRMNMLIFASTLFLVLTLIAGVKVFFQLDLVFILYLTFGICLPLCFVLIHIHKKQLNANYKLLSHIYKLVMLIGVFSLILFKL
jgi:4-hydroxybenzoate polyprenyltransferase